MGRVSMLVILNIVFAAALALLPKSLAADRATSAPSSLDPPHGQDPASARSLVAGAGLQRGRAVAGVHGVDEVAGVQRQRLHGVRRGRRRGVPRRQLRLQGRARGLPHGPRRQDARRDPEEELLRDVQ
jgi:hypothetical protein